MTAIFSQHVDFRNEFSVLFGVHNPVTYKDAIRVAPGQKVVTIFYTDQARANITDPRGSCTKGKLSIVRK